MAAGGRSETETGAGGVVSRGQSLTESWKLHWQDLLIDGRAGEVGPEKSPVLSPALLTI